MMRDKSSLGRMIYLAMNVLFLVGWLCALIGLSLAQQNCKDSPLQDYRLASSFTAAKLGKECRSFYRLPWLVWALNTVPVLLAVVAVIKPHLARGATTAFFSVLAPLDILMAHDWYNRSEAADSLGYSGKDMSKFEVTLAGFAIMAAMALLLLLLDSLLAIPVKPGTSAAASEAAHHQGGVGAAPVNKV